MSHFHLHEGSQIWMTFYFYFFHSVENEKIVLFKLFWPKITHYTFVHSRLKFEMKPDWHPKRNVAFSFTWRAANLNDFLYLFFQSVENEKIVSFKLFRPKIKHSFVHGWNLKRNPVETPNEMPHFPVLEGPQIWMTFYFNFFRSVHNEKML
jgi:hypothetical protein